MPVIFSYTRKQAIEDGVLVDLTPFAKETGFKIPVACTAAVWHEYVVPPEKMKQWGQSERGQGSRPLMDVIRSDPQPEDQAALSKVRTCCFYEVLFQQEPGKTITVRFKSHLRPGR